MLHSVVQISQAHRSLAQEVIDRQIVEGTKKPYAKDIYIAFHSLARRALSWLR
jgi:hypothetical protein